MPAETNYLDEVAARIWAGVYGVRALSPRVFRTDTFELYRIYAVLALSRGEHTTCRDAHVAWSAWAAPRKPDHSMMVPFDELSPEDQSLYQPYVEAIHAVARELEGGQ